MIPKYIFWPGYIHGFYYVREDTLLYKTTINGIHSHGCVIKGKPLMINEFSNLHPNAVSLSTIHLADAIPVVGGVGRQHSIIPESYSSLSFARGPECLNNSIQHNSARIV